MLEVRRIARAEVMDLFHAKVGDGWKVVRWTGKSKRDAIKRLQFLANKARNWNESLDLIQSIPQIGKAGIAEKENILIDYLEPNDYRLKVRVYDTIREFLLVAILFGIADGEKIGNPLQLQG